MSTLANVCRVQEETKEVTPWRKDMTLNASLRRHDQAGERLMMRCHQYCGGATDSIHRHSIGRFQLYVKMATSIVTRGLCVIEARDFKIELVPWSEQTAAVTPKEKLALKSLDLVEWNTCQMAVKKVKQPGVGTREPIDKQPGVGTLEPTAGEFTKQPSVTKQLRQISEKRSGCRCSRRCRRMHARSNTKVPAEQQWDTEAQGPECHGAYLEPVTCLRWFSRSRCIARVRQEVSQLSAKPAPQWGSVRESAGKDERSQQSFRCYAIGHRRGEYHTVMLETPVCRAVAENSKRKTDSMFSLRVDWLPAAVMTMVWTEDSLCTQDAWCCRTQQKAPGPSEAQRNKHDDRGEADDEECLKHTKKATHPERDEGWWHDVNDFHTHAACGGPCKQREVNRRGAERGTTLEELQDNVNQKIVEVTRKQAANDGKHRDELPQTRRRKAVSVWDEAENYQDEDETNKLNIETVWSGESKAVM